MGRPTTYGRGTGCNKRDGSLGRLEKRFLDEVVLSMPRMVWWRFEPVSFRIAKGASYLADFAVMLDDGTVTFYEVKGVWLEAARVRIKVAAEAFPFRFVGVMWDRKTKSWVYEEF